MNRTSKKVALPNVPRGVDIETRRFLIAVKELLERQQGVRPNQSVLDEVVTMRHLQNMGVDINMTKDSQKTYDFSSLL